MQSYKQSARNNEKQTSIQRKISRRAHDPIRIETGAAPNYGELIAIKAVRLG